MKKNGFSLVEVICVLILLGIMASIATIGISRTVSQFNFTRERDALTQKAQIALNRWLIEFTYFDTAGTAGTFDIVTTSNVTTYYYPANYAGTTQRNNFSYDSNADQLYWNGNLLCDGVASFSVTPNPSPATAATLKYLTISMQIKDVSSPLSSTIAIKNLTH